MLWLTYICDLLFFKFWVKESFLYLSNLKHYTFKMYHLIFQTIGLWSIHICSIFRLTLNLSKKCHCVWTLPMSFCKAAAASLLARLPKLFYVFPYISLLNNMDVPVTETETENSVNRCFCQNRNRKIKNSITETDKKQQHFRFYEKHISLKFVLFCL